MFVGCDAGDERFTVALVVTATNSVAPARAARKGPASDRP
jgi:hypothetical protein